MLEIFLEKRQLLKAKENIFKHRQHPKALILLTVPLAGKTLESLKSRGYLYCLVSEKGSDLSEAVCWSVSTPLPQNPNGSLKRLGGKPQGQIASDRRRDPWKKDLKKARDNFYGPLAIP